MSWMFIIENSMVGAIVIARLYVMYQQSKIILILLVSIYSAFAIPCIVIRIITFPYEELVLFSQYSCTAVGGNARLRAINWVLGAIWEVLSLSLVAWIAVKHFRELPTGWTIEDCFTVLMRYHVLYFVAFVAAACLSIGELSSSMTSKSDPMEGNVYAGVITILTTVEMFVLAPRLVLSIRQYKAKVAAGSDEMTIMTSITFQERTQMSNGNDV